MADAGEKFDVAIIGGGLAGLTLALQLHRASPDLEIVVLERDALPPPAAAHKVGESTVEIGAHYFSHTLGLGEMLERSQLRKFGLRYFFGAGGHDDLAGTDELGIGSLLPVISYQLDRGTLEGDLVDILRERGIVVKDDCVVKRANLGDNDSSHALETVINKVPATIHCRWLVDASSIAAVLKRKLGIGKPCEHRMGAAWLRLDKLVDVDDWSESAAWRGQCDGPRRLSTNHLMGSGYWAWIIPLAEDRTSIGLVADPDIHPLSTFNTIDRFSNWMSSNQPRLARELDESRDALMDFRFRKNLSQDSGQLWSVDRWALTGEAGLFADPFYSPGSDLIAISNSFICDLIRRERSGSRFEVHAAVYQQMYQSIYRTTMSLYEGLYPGFGDTRLMVVKTTWDYAYNWSVLTWLYFRELLTDIRFLQSVQSRLVAIRALNDEMQATFRQRAAERREDAGQGRFFDQATIPLLYELKAALLEPTANPGKEFEDNCKRLEELSPILLSLLAGEAPASKGGCSLLGDLRQQLGQL